MSIHLPPPLEADKATTAMQKLRQCSSVINMSLPGYTGEITAGVAGALLLILCIILLILYRNWRYEQELDSLLWKIDFKELTIHESDKDLSEKKQTRVRIPPAAG